MLIQDNTVDKLHTQIQSCNLLDNPEKPNYDSNLRPPNI
jgi:hypothetical protein